MSDEEEEQTKEVQKLTYGSIISISFGQDNNSFITSDGHVSQEVHLFNYSSNKQNFKKDKLKRDQENTKRNFSNCLFLIYPKSSNRAKQEILNKLNLNTDGEQVKQNFNVDLDNEQVVAQQQLLLSEYKYNYDSFQKQKGLPVNYNQALQLMHLNSCKFLACHATEAVHEKESFHVTLDDYTSDATVWKFSPSYKYQKDGDQVIFANEITLIERFVPLHNKKTYLKCSSELENLKIPKEINNINRSKQMQSSKLNQSKQNKSQQQSQQMRKTFQEEVIIKREINASTEEHEAWKINLFHDFPLEPDSYLRCGDVIWLHHSEANSIIASARLQKGVDKYNFSSLNIETWLAQENLHIIVEESITGDEFSDYSGNTFGMWVIQSEIQSEGGFVEYNKYYRLRHLSSGSYLSVQNSESGDGNNLNQGKPNDVKHYYLKLSLDPDPSTLFEFKQLDTDKMKASDNKVQSGQFAFVQNVKEQRYLDISSASGKEIRQCKKDLDHNFVTSLKKKRNDNQLFRLYKANTDDIWEINYVLSTFRQLASFIISLKKLKVRSDKDEQNMNKLTKKIKTCQKCVKELDLFVNNKLGNTKPEDKFGNNNLHRQKLLQEQYFIDVLIKILEDTLPKEDILRWTHKDQILKQYEEQNKKLLEGQSEKDKKKAAKDGKIDQKEFMIFLEEKVSLCRNIYRLIISLCNESSSNELISFDLIPFFQIHAKYIPEAVECISEICRHNENLLYRLTENLKIDFDHNKQAAVVQDQSKTVKFLINLYDGHQYDKEQEIIDNEHVIFRQHEKLTSKPINLIQYFMNLLWDQSAPNQHTYLDFLSSVCRIEDRGMSLNQENIFKLYKTYNSLRDEPVLSVDQFFKDGQLALRQQNNDELVYAISLLKFYSQVSYGRNFLWRKELDQHFQDEYLYKNIWNPDSEIYNKGDLSAHFCNLANSLFIDHDPLNKVSIPNYCRLFKQCEVSQKDNSLDNFPDKRKDLSLLVDNLLEYLERKFKLINSEIQKRKPEVKSKAEESADFKKRQQIIGTDQKVADLLKDELLMNSIDLYYVLLRLNVFEILDKTDHYQLILKFILVFLQFSKNNIKFVGALLHTDSVAQGSRIKARDQLTGMSMSMFSSITNVVSLQKKEEDDDEVEEQDVQLGNDLQIQNLFYNPIMRGFGKLNNALQDVTFEDYHTIRTELSIKTRVCEIVSYHLDQRQDYLMSNTLNWFLQSIVNEKDKDEAFKFVEKKLELNIKGIMPNIAKTGITDVDDMFKPGEQGGGSTFKLSIPIGESKQHKFKNYTDKNFTKYNPIDFLLAKAEFEKKHYEKEEENPSCAVLPKLLSAFILVTDENLQKIILKIILRLFNQRLELKNNLQKMLIIFDQEKTEMYQYIAKQISSLKTLIEKSEIWLASVVSAEQSGLDSIQQIIEILKNLKNSFYKDTYIIDGNVCMQETNQLEIDSDKQQILRYLNCSDTIMQLIKDGVPYLQNYLMDPHISQDIKEDLIIMFTLAHTTLKEFVKGNITNQNILVLEVQTLLRYAKIDVGQISLVCEIFRNNYKLLEHFDQQLIEFFINLIENEGRQFHFLEFFEVIQSITQQQENQGDKKSQTQFLFENQLIVLNSFLPLKNIGERQIKLLYADGSQDNEIGMYFEDASSLQQLNFLEKLKEVDFRDTYRDEPFLYHAKLLNLILKTTLDQCKEYADILDFLETTKIIFNISINKVKKTFSMTYLIQLLECPDDYMRGSNNMSKREWLDNQDFDQMDINQRDLYEEQKAYKMGGFSYLKPHILNFLRCVHILSDKDYVNNFVTEITIEQREFSIYIDSERRRLQEIQNSQKYTDDYVIYLFDYLLSTLIAYIEKYFPAKKTKVYRLNTDEIRRDQESVLKFSQTLMKQYKYFEYRIDARQELRAQTFCGNFDRTAEELYVEKKVEQEVVIVNKKHDEKGGVTFEKEEKEEKHPLRRMQTKKIHRALGKINVINKFEAKKAHDELVQHKKSGGGKLKQREFDIQSAWDKFRELLYEDYVSKEINQEISALAEVFLQIDKLCSEDMIGKIEPKPSLKLILKKLIDFLMTSVEDASNKSTNIALIQVMIIIISKEEDEDEKKKMQVLFEKLGAIEMVLFVISENHANFDGDLFLNFLIFINQLLEGGNYKNQMAVYNYFITNKKSEIIFKKFQGYFDKQIVSLQAKAKKKRIEQQKKGKKEQDLEEEEPEDEEEDIFCNDQDIEILAKILDFLQNCVEGHNLDLQNYLRFQFNNRNKYDMINAVADLLKTYYYDAKTQDMYDNMIKCLDTLSEFIQGPCADNQIAVSESKFFEICQDIFSIQEKADEKSQNSMKTKKSTAAMKTKKSTMGKKIRTGALEEWHISRLQNKCLILVLSLLEKRDVTKDSSIVKQIMRHLPINVIEHHLILLYEKFLKQYRCQYRLECLQHLQSEPSYQDQILEDEEDEKKPNCFKRIGQAIYKFSIASCFQFMKVLGLASEKISEQEYYAFIMQNGFYLFFLFSSYMESGERVEGNIVNEYRLKQKQVVSNKKNFFQQFLDADNIISQLIKLVYTIIMQILEQLWEFQRQAMEKMMKNDDQSAEEKKKLVKKKEEERKRILKSTFNFFFDNCAHIDVVRENELEQIFFIKLPYTKFLPKEKKTEFNDEVDRSNLKSKVEGLVKASQDLIAVCKHEERLNNYFQKNRFLAIFANYVKLWKDLSFILTLVLNLFILLSYSSVFGDRLKEPRLFMENGQTKESTQQYFFTIGFIMTMCSLFVVSFFLIKNLPLIFKKVWSNPVFKKEGNKRQGLFKTLLEMIIKCIKILIQILQEIEVMYYIAYGFFSVCGTFWHPFFFVFHLTEILLRYPTLKSVIRSVYIPRDQLGLTFILFMIVIYVFTIVGHVFFRQSYNDGEELVCEDIFWCFLFMLDTTFKSNAGIGGWMSDQEDDDSGNSFTTDRFFFDTLFNFIIVIILVNIVSGIIIDTFGQLRELENKKIKDIEDKCFICANKKTEFDRQSQGGFQQHIRINHYMWNYKFYIAYLEWKDAGDYTGVESYVHQKLKNNDTTWFPLNKARELFNMDEQLKKEEKEAIQKLKYNVDNLVKNGKNTYKKFAQHTKQ